MRADARRAAVGVAAFALTAGLACSVSPREGFYACDPGARPPGCPAGWFCHHRDELCWTEPEDAGTDVPNDDGMGPEVDDVLDADDAVPVDDHADADVDGTDGCALLESCNGVDDDCDGATDEQLWCPVEGVPTAQDLYAVWGVTWSDVWAVGDTGTILRWDGTAWSPVESGTPEDLRGVWASAADAAWAVGPAPAIVRWDGDAWTDDAPAVDWTPYDVWGVDADDVWAVGGPGKILHRQAGTWTDEPSGVLMGGRFFGVWGEAGAMVFAVGENIVIRDRELPTGSWSARLPPGMMDLFAVGGVSAGEVWVVGSGGNILRGPAATYLSVESPTTNDLRGVWAHSSADAWAVGDGGTIVHWSGGSWSEDDSGTTAGLKGVWGDASGEVWAVGAMGTILRRRP